ncbi:hypothetical protein AWC22_16865 [Mycobacterium riyadhense]|uniref:Uncharacterized protein n=1 Tax=Mycobacterium riyadhense TaxID=486698 RepID=A0A1X2D0Z5_9MYCO|nr:hypothetical protein AWC22_16865 [Mycobacterium riyadhense]
MSQIGESGSQTVAGHIRVGTNTAARRIQRAVNGHVLDAYMVVEPFQMTQIGGRRADMCVQVRRFRTAVSSRPAPPGLLIVG